MVEFVKVGNGKKRHIRYGTIGDYTFCLKSPIRIADLDAPICKLCEKSYKVHGYDMKELKHAK